MSPRERTMAIAAVGLIGVLAVYQLALSPLLTRADAASERLDAARAIEEERQLEIQNQLAERRRWKRIGGETLRDEPATAEGQLVNRVPAWASESGVSLSSIRPDRADASEGFGRVALRVTAAGELAEIGRFLYAIESADVPVRISDLTLVTREEGEDNLSLQLTLATIHNLPREETK